MAETYAARATFNELDRRWETLKAARLNREAEWQQIADVFLPRKDFSIPGKPTDLRRRRVTSSVPNMALIRGAGLLRGYTIDNTRPFVGANTNRGLVSAGRSTNLSDAARDYVSDLEWMVFDRMMLPQSGFLTSLAQLMVEYEAFGTGIMATLRQPGFGPRYQFRPLRRCWIAENAEGVVDTLYFEFPIAIHEAVARWPNHGVENWTKAMASGKEEDCRKEVSIVHVVEPRRHGRRGAVATQKPFREVYFCQAEKAVLGESGYESFPFSVPRLDVVDGSAYGTGLAWRALPEALILNALQQGVETAVELRNNPPLMVPQRLFGKALDRRAGAVNAYDSAKLGFQDANKAIQKLEIAGDVAIAADYLRRLEQNVEQAFFTDWMRLRDSGTMTAEEVRERRDLRVRSMSAFVPALDRELMGVAADRTLETLEAEGLLPRPPEELSGVEVDWDYKGPLALAQLKTQADAIEHVFDVALKGRGLDESSSYVVAVEESIRAVGEAYGIPPEGLRSRETVASLRERDAQQQALAQNAELMNQAAQALQAGGQGVAALSGAREAA